MCSDEYLGMIGEAEIIIGAEINYGMRFAAVGDRCSRVCGGEELRLVQLGCPRTSAHPIRKARWSFQRVVALAHKKIAQTKFCWILVHQTLRSSRRHPHAMKFRVGATILPIFGFGTRI